jgi:hypothetical protein
MRNWTLEYLSLSLVELFILLLLLLLLLLFIIIIIMTAVCNMLIPVAFHAWVTLTPGMQTVWPTGESLLCV